MTSMVTGTVVSYPSTVMPTESPTSSASAPASSKMRAMTASYAVIIAIFSPRTLLAFRSVVRTGADVIALLPKVASTEDRRDRRTFPGLHAAALGHRQQLPGHAPIQRANSGRQ